MKTGERKTTTKMARKKRKTNRKKQRGGARRRSRSRLVDKIAQGASMFLSGAAPSFATMGGKLAGQVYKGIRDNV